MTTDPKILDRLAKLMEMSERGTEHEATIAGERAAELMAKHQLTMLDVTSHIAGQSVIAVEQGRVDDEEQAPMGKRRELWMEVLLVGIVEGLGGRAWKQTRKKSYMFYMVGPPDTVGAARYLYMALEKDIARIARATMKNMGESNSFRRSFARGMAMRVGVRIKEARTAVMSTAGTALVHVSAQQKAVDDELAKRNLRVSRGGHTKTPDAIAEGYERGRDLDIGDIERAKLTEGRKRLT